MPSVRPEQEPVACWRREQRANGYKELAWRPNEWTKSSVLFTLGYGHPEPTLPQTAVLLYDALMGREFETAMPAVKNVLQDEIIALLVHHDQRDGRPLNRSLDDILDDVKVKLSLPEGMREALLQRQREQEQEREAAEAQTFLRVCQC